MAAYGNSFGEAWRNSFLEKQARDASVQASTDRLLAVLGQVQQRKMQERALQVRAQAEAADMEMRRQIFANQIAQQALANDWRQKEFAAERASEERADNIRRQGLAVDEMYKQAAAQDRADSRATEDKRFDYYRERDTARETAEERRHTEAMQRADIRLYQDQNKFAGAEDEIRKNASTLADYLNRRETLDAVGPALTHFDARVNELDGPMTWRSTAIAAATPELAARVPHTLSVDIGALANPSTRAAEQAGLSGRRGTLDLMIDNLIRSGAGDYVMQSPTGEWVVRGGAPAEAPVSTSAPAPAVDDKVVVIGPDGKRYRLPRRQLDEAMSKGYRLEESAAPDDWAGPPETAGPMPEARSLGWVGPMAPPSGPPVVMAPRPVYAPPGAPTFIGSPAVTSAPPIVIAPRPAWRP